MYLAIATRPCLNAGSSLSERSLHRGVFRAGSTLVRDATLTTHQFTANGHQYW